MDGEKIIVIKEQLLWVHPLTIGETQGQKLSIVKGSTSGQANFSEVADQDSSGPITATLPCPDLGNDPKS